MKKVVYNRCYGGFRLSPIAIKRYLELARPEVTPVFYKEEWITDRDVYTKIKVEDIKEYDDFIVLLKDYGEHPEESSIIFGPTFYKEGDYFSPWSIKRSDPNLVKVVEELGEKANGDHASLAIAEVIDKYRIIEYDGSESVETPESIKWEE